MTLTAFFLILLSVFLHAGWNFLSKAGLPSAAFYLLMALTEWTMTLPFLLLADTGVGEMGPRFWLLLLGSGVSEICYVLGLYHAYRRCDISLAYPMARALPVLTVPLVTIAFGFGEPPAGIALAGMAAVVVGCLLMPLRTLAEFRPGIYVNPALGAILLAAIGTTGYTVCDSQALSMLIATGKGGRISCCFVYLSLVEVQIIIGLVVYILLHRREQVAFRQLFLKSYWPPLAGFFAASAYLLVLLAMGFVTNVSFVQVFRQMSLPLGVLAGIFLLKERCPPVKLAGISLVLLGLLLTAVS